MIHMIEFYAMGCNVNVQLESGSNATALLRELPTAVAELEAILTRFDTESELMRLNARAGQWVEVSDVLFDVIEAAQHAAWLTEGLFNPLILPALTAYGYDRDFDAMRVVPRATPQSVPDWRDLCVRPSTKQVKVPAGIALDLGGIAKGWTSAYLADHLSVCGPCLVNIGGDITGRGTPAGYEGWPVEVECPNTNERFATIYLEDRTIVTSGTDYRRWTNETDVFYNHIIDPQTGAPTTSDALSVTVMHDDATTAEAYATAVLLRGVKDGIGWLQSQTAGEGVAFDADCRTYVTQSFIPKMSERKAIPCHIPFALS
ncbi:MAG: FAD:protein FMN transferase [Chloroflexota bacterium]